MFRMDGCIIPKRNEIMMLNEDAKEHNLKKDGGKNKTNFKALKNHTEKPCTTHLDKTTNDNRIKTDFDRYKDMKAEYVTKFKKLKRYKAANDSHSYGKLNRNEVKPKVRLFNKENIDLCDENVKTGMKVVGILCQITNQEKIEEDIEVCENKNNECVPKYKKHKYVMQ